jgi:hypothetical protein
VHAGGNVVMLAKIKKNNEYEIRPTLHTLQSKLIPSQTSVVVATHNPNSILVKFLRQNRSINPVEINNSYFQTLAQPFCHSATEIRLNDPNSRLHQYYSEVTGVLVNTNLKYITSYIFDKM